jgi:hypothetical protein
LDLRQQITPYEINTWVWLSELSLRTGTLVDLGKMPLDEWDAIAKSVSMPSGLGVWENRVPTRSVPKVGDQ